MEITNDPWNIINLPEKCISAKSLYEHYETSINLWTNGQINRFKQNERFSSYLVPYGKEKNQEVILGLDKFEEEGKNVKLS